MDRKRTQKSVAIEFDPLAAQKNYSVYDLIVRYSQALGEVDRPYCSLQGGIAQRSLQYTQVI